MINPRPLVFAGIFGLVLLTGCSGHTLRHAGENRAIAAASSPSTKATSPPALHFARASEYPRVDCSTSAQPLSVLVACRLTDTPCMWARAGILGERLLYPVKSRELLTSPGPPSTQPVRALQAEIDSDLAEKTASTGTHAAYVNLIQRKADLILVARPPSDREKTLAQAATVRLDVRPIALDAFVFIVNNENPARNLTLREIRGIYSGSVTRWSDVLHDPRAANLLAPVDEITAYQRQEDSGSQETMQTLVMKNLPMIKPVNVIQSMGGPFNMLWDDPNGICYTFFYYGQKIAPSLYTAKEYQVRSLAVDGVVADADSIASRKYPLVTEVYVVVLEGLPADSAPIRLRDWLLSPAGQAVVKESGYIPLPVSK